MPLTPEQSAFLNAFMRPKAGAEEAESASAVGTDGDVMAIWRTAKDSTDAGISDLQNALKSYSHPDLDRIADAGLNGLTDTNQTGMMRALMDYSAAPADKKKGAAAKLVAQTDAYLSFLESSSLITLAEQNPFGVKVEIKKTLSVALTKIARIAA